ncbi:MAG: glycosyltransferase family 39 protein [Candidatus Woesearchaeota archaeon]
MKHFKINKIIVIILLILILFQAGQLFLWIKEDKAPPAWDQSWHSLISVDRYNQLFQKDSSYGTKQLEKSYPIFGFARNYYPPFFHYTSTFSYLLFGVNYDAALFTNIFYIIIMVISCYAIGKKLDTSSTGVLLAFIIVVLPVYSLLSRDYLIDYALASMVALGYCLLLYSDNFQKMGYSIAFGIIFGLGMLTKWTYALFLFVPLLFSLYQLTAATIKTKNYQRIISAGSAFLCAAIIMLLWYTPLRIRTLFSQLSAFSNLSSGAVPLWSRSTDYLFTILNGYTALFFVLFIVATITLLQEGIRHKKHLGLTISLLLTILFTYGVLSSISNHDTRYIAPIYVFLATITALGVMHYCRKLSIKKQYILAIVLIIVGAGYNIAYNSPTINVQYTATSIPIINTMGKYPEINPPIRGEDITEILSVINRTNTKRSFSVCIIAESPYLNDVNVPYYSVLGKYNVSVMFGNGCDPRTFDFAIVGEIQKTWRSNTFESSKRVLESNIRNFREIYQSKEISVYQNMIHR